LVQIKKTVSRKQVCYDLIKENVSKIQDECIADTFTIQDEEVLVVLLVMRMIKIEQVIVIVFATKKITR
jgi:hypothetical protein